MFWKGFSFDFLIVKWVVSWGFEWLGGWIVGEVFFFFCWCWCDFVVGVAVSWGGVDSRRFLVEVLGGVVEAAGVVVGRARDWRVGAGV